MTEKMIKIKYLKRYIDLDTEINALQAESDEIIRSASGGSPKITDMPRGGSGEDKTQSAAERKIELDHKIDQKIDVLTYIRPHVYAAILTVTGKQRLVLYMRYVKGYSWAMISKKLKCSYDSKNAKKIHKRAIQNVVIPIDVPI